MEVNVLVIQQDGTQRVELREVEVPEDSEGGTPTTTPTTEDDILETVLDHEARLANLAMLCGLLAALLRSNKQRILTYATELIQKAESAVQGSGMGTEKMALVEAQLQAAGITVNSWLSAQIDTIVAALTSKGAWLAEQTKQASSGLENAVSDSDAVASDAK